MQNRLGGQDLSIALRALANRLTLKARDAAAEAKRKEQGDPQAEYLRGLAEGYYKAALDLAQVLKDQGKPLQAAASSAEGTGQLASDAEPEYDTSLHLNEVMRMLEHIGIVPRDVTPYKDGTYHAVFSKWQNMTDGERVEKIRVMDGRLVLLAQGRTKETNDPFVTFAFRKS
jgi:ABC-type transporter Mla subunit MlaD